MKTKEYGFNTNGDTYVKTPTWMVKFKFSGSPVNYDNEVILPESYWDKMEEWLDETPGVTGWDDYGEEDSLF